MCENCDERMYDLVITDRGNFIILTDPVKGSPFAPNVVPGVEYLTTITPIGLMRPKDEYDALILLARFGQSIDGCSASIAPAGDMDEADHNHNVAIMLAMTHDFTWMSVDEQHEVIYGFTLTEGVPTE